MRSYRLAEHRPGLRGADRRSSLAQGGMLVTQSDLTVQGAHRAAAGQVEVHDKETDVLYITDGEATFVTGGTMIGGKNTKAGQWLGTDIQGGESHHLSKGDVIVIPAGVPHWFQGSAEIRKLFRGEGDQAVNRRVLTRSHCMYRLLRPDRVVKYLEPGD